MDSKILLAVAGNPVIHSKSPFVFEGLIHNYNINASYTRLSAESSQELVSLINKLGISGLNITSPFKETIIPLLDSIDTSVAKIQSVNTVVNQSGKLRGFNTDADGIINIFKKRQIEIRGKNCVVIGAGGAARSAVFALRSEGALVTVLNRSKEKADNLAVYFDCRSVDLASINDCFEKAEIIISTVNIRLLEEYLQANNFSFIPYENLNNNVIILDAIYHNSALKEKAEKLGINYISGEEWLLEQALLSFKIFSPSQRSLLYCYWSYLDFILVTKVLEA